MRNRSARAQELKCPLLVPRSFCACTDGHAAYKERSWARPLHRHGTKIRAASSRLKQPFRLWLARAAEAPHCLVSAARRRTYDVRRTAEKVGKRAGRGGAPSPNCPRYSAIGTSVVRLYMKSSSERSPLCSLSKISSNSTRYRSMPPIPPNPCRNWLPSGVLSVMNSSFAPKFM